MTHMDYFPEGAARGWRLVDASRLERDVVAEADVVIVGSGAGGGIAAEILARSGLRVIVIEEGPLRTTRDFHMKEAEAYPDLYQESAARKTADKGITILQGRCVGGSTTVNWTSSFRTPATTLAYWQRQFGLTDLTVEHLRPWFEMVERRLNIHEWEFKPNPNNEVLRTGGRQVGIEVRTMRRNVRGCWDLGYCGMGCPTYAKQSMLVTTLPVALELGATLYSRLRALRLRMEGERVAGVDCVAMDERGIHPRAITVTLHARHVVLAAGAIGSPAFLLRSGVPDPQGLIGKRTFLHPTVISAALLDDVIAGYKGAPQSLYSDHYLDSQAVDAAIGYKLESAPLHPVLFSSTLQHYGTEHGQLMERFPHAQVVLALLRDGFHARSPGGNVGLRQDGTPVLDYPLNDYLWEGVRRALLSMAEIQFAAGARRVFAVHEDCHGWNSWTEARAGIAALALRPLSMRVVSAHVMGGCAMGKDATQAVVDARGRPHHFAGLTVADGSLFPTSVGANPQESVYGLAARNISLLAEELTGRPAAPLA